jgi:hypothetical protein
MVMRANRNDEPQSIALLRKTLRYLLCGNTSVRIRAAGELHWRS